MSRADRTERLAREAVRLLERYHAEVVEAFGLCPWAKAARLSGLTRTRVITSDPCDPADAARLIEDESEDAAFDVAFLIAPLFSRGLEAFSAWSTQVAGQLGDRFLCAPFYPQVAGGTSAVRFFRQTPDPTLQLVRRCRVDEVRAQDPPHYRDIFKLRMADLEAARAPKTAAASVIEHNERVLEEKGRAAIQGILDDIGADRARSYAGLVKVAG